MRTLLWFRGKDLRVHDHAALAAALRADDELIPVFVLDPAYFELPLRHEVPHRLQFLLASLRELEQQLEARGSQLLLFRGPAGRTIPELAERLRVDRVFATASVEPNSRARDERLSKVLRVPFKLFKQETLLDPELVLTKSGGPFRVYTPFSRAALTLLEGDLKPKPAPTPEHLPPLPKLALPRRAELPTLESLEIERNPHLHHGGETAGRKRVKSFLTSGIDDYDSARDRMDQAGTSRLSADLHFGTLSIRDVWCALERKQGADADSMKRYRLELLWREFSHYTLWHRPNVLSEPFREDFKEFPWRGSRKQDAREAAADYEAWWRGQTGYPVVDASARQLLREGFVHNRARMITASFLTKHLLISYQRGEAHFLQYLTDGDLAQNNMGWQWSAGCGCDAQPYFRIFNPVTQGQRFDPEGDYVRKYVPELARMPARFIHAPWLAPKDVLQQAGVQLGKNYPLPIVDHASARKRYLLVASDHLKRGA